MGKPTGFLEYERKESVGEAPLKRIKHFNEFHTPLSKKEQERQGARCMNCGVPFCQSGILIKGMVTGCPLNNLIPEWNDATYTGNWDEAYNRLRKTNPFPEFTGRVCPHPCEVGCTCNLGGDPVNIKEKELSIIERAYESGLIKPEPPEVRNRKDSCYRRFRSIRTLRGRILKPPWPFCNCLRAFRPCWWTAHVRNS